MPAPGGIGRRIYRFLRSPRVGAGLLIAVGAWLVLGAALPQRSADPGGVARWALAHPTLERLARPLGLHQAFSRPLFLGIVLLLAASTAVCAWDRSSRAIRALRSHGTLTEAQVAALVRAPGLQLAEGEVHDPGLALARAAGALRSMHLRVRQGPKVVEAASGAWGLLGSPVFHWALVALLLVVPLGRLLRSEGLMGIVEGSSVIDERAAYGLVDEGPLHRTFTGLDIGVQSGMPVAFEQDGVNRGAAPVVTLSRDGVQLTSQRVYPNHPLRYGALTIHASDYGAGTVYSLSRGGDTLVDQALMDFTDEARSRASAYHATFTNPDGSALTSITIEIATREQVRASGFSSGERMVIVAATRLDGGTERKLARAGDTLDLGEGLTLTVDKIGYYARLSVVYDPTVTPMYALFVLAIVSVSVSVLVPYRVARVMLDTADGTPVLRVTASHSRGAPGFADSVRAALRPPDAEEDSPR